MDRFWRRTLFPLVALALGCWAAGQFPPVQPSQAGFSTERLSRLDAVIQAHVDRGEIPGAVVLVLRDGRAVHSAAYGYLDRESGKPMVRDAVFRVASMTKLVTSVAVLQLYEESLFNLNDPVSRFLSEFKEMRVAVSDPGGGDGGGAAGEPGGDPLQTEPAKREITVRDLLAHTSGIIYGQGKGPLDKMYQRSGAWTSRDKPLSEFTSKLAALPLAFQPGSRWSYGLSTDVLGRLVEVVSGMSLDEYCEERIFRPLGMADSGFRIGEKQAARFATVYEFRDGRLHPKDSSDAKRWRTRPEGCSGGGGMVSTAPDYAKLLQALLNGGALDGRRILGRKAVELLTANHLAGIPRECWFKPGVGFGLGVAVLADPGVDGEMGSPGSWWWVGILNTFFFVDPKERLVCVFMTQVQPFGHLGIMDRFRRLCLAALVD